MTWLTWLIVAAIVTGIAALTGLKPNGTRHVAHTQLIGVARVAFIVIALIIAYVVYKTR